MLWKQNRENLLPLKKINGDQAELLAKQFLEEQDLIFIAKNFSCRFGEIDLIFTDSKSIIFTEVRYRSTQFRGSAAESITPSKRKRIVKTAQYWLKEKQLELSPIRFDAILFDGEVSKHNLNWIKAIF
ncbi:YraN family protein [Marinomonas algicola]|uniref:YraN family protein n=1 Tax=Marinomonas algicola TaxID=2773454 RepID=UPI00174DAB10|nr:YraN family protein [Marinomonas algicola]